LTPEWLAASRLAGSSNRWKTLLKGAKRIASRQPNSSSQKRSDSSTGSAVNEKGLLGFAALRAGGVRKRREVE
jgi:hypothetical protein